MNTLDRKIRAVEEAETDDFVSLARLAGLNPATDFRWANIEGVDFSYTNLTGFDFTGAKMKGCVFRGAKVSHAIFTQAELDDHAFVDASTGLDGFEGSPVDPRYTFKSFVVGAPNRVAHAAALQVAENAPAQPLKYNPLYIHARAGMGKTHLLHAIAWEMKQRNPNAKVLYLTAERFMYSFAEPLQTRDAPAFKEKLRTIDLLLVDDMEFLQGRTFQQEFCHTLNSLIDGGKQVVVAADCAPLLLESFDARMRSRFSSGQVVELGALDYELRLKILRRIAAEKAAASPSFDVPADVLEYLATQPTENGRELEGAITRLLTTYQLTGKPLSIDTAESTIEDLIRSKEPKGVKIDDILRIVAKHYRVQRGDLLSSRRNQSIVRPRQIGMYLAKTLTSRSLPEIGRRFGGRDPATVLYAIRKIGSLKLFDQVLKEELDSLSRMLKDGTI
jgi:chromosomal replication initiator protein